MRPEKPPLRGEPGDGPERAPTGPRRGPRSAGRWVALIGAMLLGFGTHAHAQDPPSAPPSDAATQRALARPEPATLAVNGGPTPEDVVASALAFHPALREADAKRAAADAKADAAMGAWDLGLRAGASTDVVGPYAERALSAGVVQETRARGLDLRAGYRFGEDFPSYYEEKETDPLGEWSIGVSAPLLRDGATDPARTALRTATEAAARAEAERREKAVAIAAYARAAHAKWWASSEKERIATELLAIADERTRAVEARVAIGDLAPLDRLDNERIVLERQGALAGATRDREVAALTLSLFYRDDAGRPRVVAGAAGALPPPEATLGADPEADLAAARIPALEALDAAIREAEARARLAANQTLPDLTVRSELSQERGAETPETALTVGFGFAMPAQRRAAFGNEAAANAEVERLVAARQLAGEQVRADVLQAAAGLRAARTRAALAERAVVLARELEIAEQTRFDQGEATLFDLYLREQNLGAAERAAVDAALEVHLAAAEYRAALGIAALP